MQSIRVFDSDLHTLKRSAKHIMVVSDDARVWTERGSRPGTTRMHILSEDVGAIVIQFEMVDHHTYKARQVWAMGEREDLALQYRDNHNLLVVPYPRESAFRMAFEVQQYQAEREGIPF